MISLTLNGLVIVLLPAQVVTPGTEPTNVATQQSSPKEKVIQAAADAYKLFWGSEPRRELIRTGNPVLRFDDSVTLSQHGSVYLWTERDGRPLAIASLYFQADGARVDEFQSLATTGILTAEYEGQVVWAPKATGIEFKLIEDEHDVPDSKERRLGRMRNIARRFSAAVMDRRAGRLELRFVPQPLYRYGDNEQGLIDGGLFSFAKGTNPEVVLLLEARLQGGASSWHYAVARMSARGCNATLDGREVWSLTSVGYKQDADQAYFNRYTR